MYEFHHYVWDSQQSVDGQKQAANNLVNSLKVFKVPIYIGEFTFFELEEAWSYVLNLFNKNGYHYTSWSFKSNNMGTWGTYNQKGTEKVNVYNNDINEIIRKWGESNVGTGKASKNGMVYNKMKENLPGTIYFLKEPLENKKYFSLKVLNNNKFISADEYGLGQLRANRDGTGTWEKFLYVYK